MTGAATAILYWVLRRFTPSTVPFADGLTVALFLTAQFMMSKKIVQNWWFWIVGDVLVIGLYIYKQLYLTSALYAFFLAMCIAGLLEWQKASRRPPWRQLKWPLQMPYHSGHGGTQRQQERLGS